MTATARARQREAVSADAYQAMQRESDFQAAVIDLAKLYGWLCVHIRSMVANPSGLPDLLLWKNERYCLVELKTERGVVSERQRQWHERAAAHGVVVHVFRPSQWDDLEAVLRGEG